MRPSFPRCCICRKPVCLEAGTRGSLGPGRIWSKPMMDILMLAITAGLFAVGIGYAYVCERL